MAPVKCISVLLEFCGWTNSLESASDDNTKEETHHWQQDRTASTFGKALQLHARLSCSCPSASLWPLRGGGGFHVIFLPGEVLYDLSLYIDFVHKYINIAAVVVRRNTQVTAPFSEISG